MEIAPPGQVGTLQGGGGVEARKKRSAQNKSEGIIHGDVDVSKLVPLPGTRVVTKTAVLMFLKAALRTRVSRTTVRTHRATYYPRVRTQRQARTQAKRVKK